MIMMTPHNALLPSQSRSWALRALVVAGLAIVLSGFTVPAAQATSYTYVNNMNTSEGQVRQSSLLSNVDGGGSATYTAAISHIITFNPGPGYVEWGHSYSGGATVMTHANVTNAYSKCYWYAAGGGGSTGMSCNATW